MNGKINPDPPHFPYYRLKKAFRKASPEIQLKAAGVLAFLSESAQEEIYLLTTDHSGSIVNLHKYSKGSNVESAATVYQMAGHLLEMPDAHTVYLVHNHPSGDLLPSPADNWILKTLKNTLGIQHIDTKGVLIGNR